MPTMDDTTVIALTIHPAGIHPAGFIPDVDECPWCKEALRMAAQIMKNLKENAKTRVASAAQNPQSEDDEAAVIAASYRGRCQNDQESCALGTTHMFKANGKWTSLCDEHAARVIPFFPSVQPACVSCYARLTGKEPFGAQRQSNYATCAHCGDLTNDGYYTRTMDPRALPFPTLQE